MLAVGAWSALALRRVWLAAFTRAVRKSDESARLTVAAAAYAGCCVVESGDIVVAR